jgi:hypothetical protein
MELRFYRQDLYGSYAEANEKGGLKEIYGLTTEYRRLFDVGGDLADALSAIHTTSKMFNDKSTIRYVLLDDDGTFLDAC